MTINVYELKIITIIRSPPKVPKIRPAALQGYPYSGSGVLEHLPTAQCGPRKYLLQ
jgi:hypothetical protein